MTQVSNISFYHFVPLAAAEPLRSQLQTLCLHLNILGTILLGNEGINVSVAGTPEATKRFCQEIKNWIPGSEKTLFKESFSDFVPFKQLKIKWKNEIVTMGTPTVNPLSVQTDHLSPEKLKAWLEEKKDFLLVDVRNDYEFKLGTFAGAETLPIEHFRQFPDQVEKLKALQNKRPVVMFCTGGIRCEKAAPLLALEGFENVYQLEGGILNYFEKCGGQHWNGECFVFDDRIALTPELKVSGAFLCDQCQFPLQQGSVSCFHCHSTVRH